MRRLLLSTACLISLSTPVCAAEEMREEDNKGILNVVVENDTFAGADRDYTNGIRFSWLSSEENMPSWTRNVAHALPLASEGHKRISLAAGQSMFAPEDLTSQNLVAGQHPYAGWLYGSVGMVSDTGKTLDNVVLTLGMVGPSSYAEQSQKFIHHQVKGSPQPQGWSHQLHDELGVNFAYERKWRNIFEVSTF